jgi:hypothetical protein
VKTPKKKKPITKRDNFDRNYMRHLVQEDEENLWKCLEEAEDEDRRKDQTVR